MKRMILICAAVLMAATACGDVIDDAATTTSEVEADSGEATATGGAAEDPEPSASSQQLLDSGSGDGASTDPPATTIAEERIVEDESLPERVPPTSDTPVTGEADSSLVASIKQDLITRTGAAESAIAVIRSEEVIWNDGALGCPEPGEMYTQALVNGFWVVLEYSGSQYDYRASARGSFKLCEGFGLPPTNPTG